MKGNYLLICLKYDYNAFQIDFENINTIKEKK